MYLQSSCSRTVTEQHLATRISHKKHFGQTAYIYYISCIVSWLKLRQQQCLMVLPEELPLKGVAGGYTTSNVLYGRSLCVDI